MVDTELKMTSDGTEDRFSGQDIRHIDESVEEVFSMMFGFTTELVSGPEAASEPSHQPEITAVIGFSGSLRGSCGIRMTSHAAIAVASAMLGGAPIDEHDGSVEDAVGELCNMLAGGWKNRLSGPASNCMVSPPAVISGTDYSVHMATFAEKVLRTYSFADHRVHLTLVLHQRTAA